MNNGWIWASIVFSLIPAVLFLGWCVWNLICIVRNEGKLGRTSGDNEGKLGRTSGDNEGKLGRTSGDTVEHGKNSTKGYRKKKTAAVGILLATGLLFMAILAQRLAVEYYINCIPPEALCSACEYVEMTWVERLFDGVVHTLQTFSMDEEYTAFLQNGKKMVAAILPETWPAEQLGNLYGGYVSLLNMLAPILGGAILFELLANIFPVIKLCLSYLLVWKERIFFSELNENSVALAQSIREQETSVLKRPVLIFTDAYVDRDNEKTNELRLEAKACGAICLREDLAHIWKPSKICKKYVFFLIDIQEIRNLQALTHLAESQNRKCLRRARVYLFSQSSIYMPVEQAVWNTLKDAFAKEEYPMILPVQSFRNLVTGLLVELPLFEPLIKPAEEPEEKDADESAEMGGEKTAEKEEPMPAVQKEPKPSEDMKHLYVTILGFGNIGTEMFLAVYWMGQMLDCTLHIQVVSKEDKEEFWKKIDYINPEIRKTVETDGVWDRNTLKYRNGEFSEPYAHVRYIQADVKSGSFINLDENRDLLKTQYFVVALGSDEDNISVAQKLRKIMGKAYIDGEETDAVHNTVIAYAVFDSDLCDTLNKQCIVKEIPEICMRAFGSLRDVYSYENIYMSKYRNAGSSINSQYTAEQLRRNHIADSSSRREMEKYEDGDYSYWSNLARAMHVPYKMYSIGCIQESVFTIFEDPLKQEKEKQDAYSCSLAYREKVYKKYRDACVWIQYKEKSQEVSASIVNDENIIALLSDKGMKDRLAWLEHRRWCAFSRVRGFQNSVKYDVYAERTDNSYKHMPLQLHPCLVECNMTGIHAKVDVKKIGNEKKVDWTCTDEKNLDTLDILSKDLIEKELNDYDFKIYDYPGMDFSEMCSGDAAGILRIEENKLIQKCERGKVVGAVKSDAGGWLISMAGVEKILSKKYYIQKEALAELGMKDEPAEKLEGLGLCGMYKYKYLEKYIYIVPKKAVKDYLEEQQKKQKEEQKKASDGTVKKRYRIKCILKKRK